MLETYKKIESNCHHLIFSLDCQKSLPFLKINKNIDEKLKNWINLLTMDIINAHKNHKMFSAVYSFRHRDEEFKSLLRPKTTKNFHPVVKDAYFFTIQKNLLEDYNKLHSSKILRTDIIQETSFEKQIPESIVEDAFLIFEESNIEKNIGLREIILRYK